MDSAAAGLDFGSKRVGVALVTDHQQPQRLTTLSNDDRLLEALGQLLLKHSITTVVVGLPRNLEGQDTPQTALARTFADQLQQTNQQITVVLQDEAVTSELAAQRLKDEGVASPEALVDQEAAVIILEDYLREH